MPAGWTTRWYSSAWKEFQLSSVVLVTFEIAFVVVIIAGLLGVMTAYALARRDFPGKRLIILLFLLPLLIPPLTYGIPLATVLYQMGLGGTFWGVVLINLVPSFPFVVLVMIPFIEQIDPLERRASSCVFFCRSCSPACWRHCSSFLCARLRCSN
jgi:putative spermidine/putrescine transport system permease protein